MLLLNHALQIMLFYGLTSMAAEYAMLYSDARRSSCIEGSAKAVGAVEWKQSLPYESKKGTRFVFTNGGYFIVTGFSEYFIVNVNGGVSSEGKIAPLSPVALHKNLFHFTGPESNHYLSAVSCGGQKIIDQKPIPGGGSLPLFLPIDNGLICHSFDRNPSGAVLQSIYAMRHDQLGHFDWIYSSQFGDIPVPTIVCNAQERLVATTPLLKAQVFDLAAPKTANRTAAPLLEFDYPFGSSAKHLSAGADGTLYWAGQDSSSLLLAATDLDGKSLWQLPPITGKFPLDADLIAPALVTPSRQYLATKRCLHAIESGAQLWTYATPDFNFTFATALSDNTVLLAKESNVVLIDSNGKEILNIDIKEKITAPPIIDNNGRIIIATNESLIAIK